MSGTPPNAGMIPEVVEKALRTLIVMAAIVAFASMFGWGMYETWTSPPGKPPEYGEPFLYVATTLAALIAGIVAVGFGLKPPGHNPISPLLSRNLLGLSRLMFPVIRRTLEIEAADEEVDWQARVAGIYAIVYVLWGIAAIVTWVVRSTEMSALIKNLATTFLGMAVPMVAAYFGNA